MNLHKEERNLMKTDFKSNFEKRKRKLTESAVFFKCERTQTIGWVGQFLH